MSLRLRTSLPVCLLLRSTDCPTAIATAAATDAARHQSGDAGISAVSAPRARWPAPSHPSWTAVACSHLLRRDRYDSTQPDPALPESCWRSGAPASAYMQSYSYRSGKSLAPHGGYTAGCWVVAKGIEAQPKSSQGSAPVLPPSLGHPDVTRRTHSCAWGCGNGVKAQPKSPQEPQSVNSPGVGLSGSCLNI